MFCREQAARLGRRNDEIEAKGAKLIAIGNGQAQWAADFIATEGVDFPVYVDPAKRVYELFGMQRGRRMVINRKSLAHGARATSRGFRQTGVRGDPFQNGGVVVLDEHGETRYVHVESVAGDLADLDQVLTALD
ncbi:MAG: peroxiredoxin-like family protein [Acidimicrobiia bacterium]